MIWKASNVQDQTSLCHDPLGDNDYMTFLVLNFHVTALELSAPPGGLGLTCMSAQSHLAGHKFLGCFWQYVSISVCITALSL